MDITVEELQRKMTETLGDMPGCEVIMDDTLVYGSTTPQHDMMSVSQQF